MREINSRRVGVRARIEALSEKLGEAAQLVNSKACVFATGSFGRLEAGAESDLDLCIVGLEIFAPKGPYKSALSNLDAICVKADLIHATKGLGIKKFDGDGKYLAHYSSKELADSVGKDDDDYKNTLNSRLLMLLESKPILGQEIYNTVIREIIAKYWRDYEDHKEDFTPAFLVNDIIRLWRTFCVNYEARTERSPERNKEKGKVKNYKLKHSRLLTCYSSLLYMLEIYRINNCVSVSDAILMVSLTPTERLEWLFEQKAISTAKSKISDLLDLYNDFLISSANEQELGRKLMDPEQKVELSKSTYAFGDAMFTVIQAVGGNSLLHRIVVV